LLQFVARPCTGDTKRRDPGRDIVTSGKRPPVELTENWSYALITVGRHTHRRHQLFQHVGRCSSSVGRIGTRATDHRITMIDRATESIDGMRENVDAHIRPDPTRTTEIALGPDSEAGQRRLHEESRGGRQSIRFDGNWTADDVGGFRSVEHSPPRGMTSTHAIDLLLGVNTEESDHRNRAVDALRFQPALGGPRRHTGGTLVCLARRAVARPMRPHRQPCHRRGNHRRFPAPCGSGTASHGCRSIRVNGGHSLQSAGTNGLGVARPPPEDGGMRLYLYQKQAQNSSSGRIGLVNKSCYQRFGLSPPLPAKHHGGLRHRANHDQVAVGDVASPTAELLHFAYNHGVLEKHTTRLRPVITHDTGRRV